MSQPLGSIELGKFGYAPVYTATAGVRCGDERDAMDVPGQLPADGVVDKPILEPGATKLFGATLHDALALMGATPGMSADTAAEIALGYADQEGELPNYHTADSHDPASLLDIACAHWGAIAEGSRAAAYRVAGEDAHDLLSLLPVVGRRLGVAVGRSVLAGPHTADFALVNDSVINTVVAKTNLGHRGFAYDRGLAAERLSDIVDFAVRDQRYGNFAISAADVIFTGFRQAETTLKLVAGNLPQFRTHAIPGSSAQLVQTGRR